MNQAAMIARFRRAAEAAESLNALTALVARRVRILGFEHFALIHHVNPYEADSHALYLHNYPDAWGATLHVQAYFRDDPVAEVCRRQQAPFYWSDIKTLIEMSPRQRKIMSEARQHGLVNGYTVPIHEPGDPIGSCSFVTRGPLPVGSLAAAAEIGRIAFAAARRIVRRDSAGTDSRPHLTPLERNCLTLIGRGIGDAKASEVLGLTAEQVTQMIETARRKFGAASRENLIVLALYRSELRFDDMVEINQGAAGIAVARRGRSASEEPAPMARLGALFFGDNPEMH